MQLFRKFTRLFRPESDASGGGGTVDRGDTLPGAPEVDTAATDAAAAAAAAKKLEDDAAAAKLAKDLGAADPDDEDADDSSASPEDKAKKAARIPLSRHEAVLAKEREKSAALAAELAEVKNRRADTANAAVTSEALKKMEGEVEALESEYQVLLTDGKLKEAQQAMAKIRAAERTMSDARAELKIQIATTQAREIARYETALNRVEAAYPALNPEHADFDAKTEARVARLSRANQAEGMTPTAALQDAVETVLGATTAAQEKATTVTPRVDPKAVAAERKADAVAKTVKAVTGTPPSAAKVGLDTDKAGGKVTAEQAMKMSQREFATLTESDLSELRGDKL